MKGNTIYIYQERYGTQDRTLGDSTKHISRLTDKAIDPNFHGSATQEICDPEEDISMDTKAPKLVYEQAVDDHVQNFTEVKQNDIGGVWPSSISLDNKVICQQ